MIDNFHFVFGEVVHGGDGGEQIEAKFIANGCGDFNEGIFCDDEAAKARARVGGDNTWETRGQI